jgi:hypothetical protein
LVQLGLPLVNTDFEHLFSTDKADRGFLCLLSDRLDLEFNAQTATFL